VFETVGNSVRRDHPLIPSLLRRGNLGAEKNKKGAEKICSFSLYFINF